MALGPLYYAAIGSGVLAIGVVVVFLIHRHRRRSPSTLTSSAPNSAYQITPKTTASSAPSGFLGYPPSPPDLYLKPETETSPTATSPSSAGRLKKSNSTPRKPVPALDPAPAPAQGKPEMVMVTYEEGLKKLGLDRTQHVIYPDPPWFDDNGEIISTSTPPFSSDSGSRPTPTTAQLLTPSKTGRSPLMRQVSLTPAEKEAAEGRFPTDSELETTGVPSYYHFQSHPHLQEPEGAAVVSSKWKPSGFVDRNRF